MQIMQAIWFLGVLTAFYATGMPIADEIASTKTTAASKADYGKYLTKAATNGRWSLEKAVKWQQSKGYKAGMNFVSSTAENELEMFQDATWDPVTIDRELSWAQSTGFTTARVFLHNLLWQTNATAFIARVDEFLSIADKHGISAILVLLDSCWNAYPAIGVQPEPIPGVHNSQWLQAPGTQIIHDPALFASLRSYVQGITSAFKDDSRILAWDVWNEPNNSGYSDDLIAPLISQVFGWIRAVDSVSQPLTTPIWVNVEYPPYSSFQQLQLDLSDVYSFHNYEDGEHLSMAVSALQAYSLTAEQSAVEAATATYRPMICTEYMARTAGSHFEPNLAILQAAQVYAVHWGWVSGRSQTIYPWSNDAAHPATEEPATWFHDVFRANGTAFNSSEISYIQSLLLTKK